MASKVSVSLPERRVKAHYGGTMVRKESNNGPLYDYEGGDVSYVGRISGVLDFDQFLKMMTSSFNIICEDNFHVYALIDGIRFMVDNIDDISFNWDILPVDEEGFTHLYCCNEQSTIKETSIAGIMPTMPTEIQPLPPTSGHSAPLSFTSFITTHFGSKTATCTPVKKLPVKRKLPDLIIENYESSQFQFDDFTQNPTFPTQQSQVVGNVRTSDPLNEAFNEPLKEAFNEPLNEAFTEPQNYQFKRPIKVPFMEDAEFANFKDTFTEIEDATDVDLDTTSEASTEYSDYVASETAYENDEDYIAFVPGLETEEERIENEDEFFPVLNEVVKETIDCTETIPESTRNGGNGTMLCLGQEFADIYQLRDHLRMYGILNKFELKFKKNNSDKVVVICNDANCSWRCYARRLNDGYTMSIRALQEEHTCDNNGENRNKLASAPWVATKIEEEMRMHHSSFTPKDIVKLVWHKYGVKINYWLAWKARGKALEKVHGNYEDSYARVPELCRQIELSNPGSVVEYRVHPESSKFEYICVMFRSSLAGFRIACRPVIGIDGCHLNGKYSGVCLCAIGMDGNNGMFPLAIFVCSKENGYNWDKFLSIIAPSLRSHDIQLTIMSDRCKGLKNAVIEHFPDCNQRFCFRHMMKNLSIYWRGEFIHNICWRAAKAYTKQEFKRQLNDLDKAATGARAFLMREKVNMWARCEFNDFSSCDQVTNNWTESFNNFIKIVRDKPICALVTSVSFLCMKIRYDRLLEAEKWEAEGLVPRVVNIINNHRKRKNDYSFQGSGDQKYCVRHLYGEYWTVDLGKKTCDCREWQVSGIPCVHAVFIIDYYRLLMIEYTSPFFTIECYKQAYDCNISPIPHENFWEEPTEDVYPPVPTRLPGRPKSKRYKGHDEKEKNKKQRKCIKCGAFGHNARTCKGGPVAANKPPKKQRKPKQSTQPIPKPTKASTSEASQTTRSELTISGGNGASQTKSKTKQKKLQKKVFKPPRQNYIP